MNEDEDVSVGLKTVLVMLEDGRYVQRDAFDGWRMLNARIVSVPFRQFQASYGG